jgi:hypothetical protein
MHFFQASAAHLKYWLESAHKDNWGQTPFNPDPIYSINSGFHGPEPTVGTVGKKQAADGLDCGF